MISLYCSLNRKIVNIKESILAVVLLIVITGSGLTSFAWSAEIVDRIIAVVNDEIITYTMLNEAFKPYEKRIKAQNFPFMKEMEVRFEFRERVINQMIDEKITEQEVKRLGIKVDNSEIDAAIERAKSMNSLTDERLRKELEKEGFTMETYRKNIRSELLRTRLIQYEVKSKIIVTDGEVESHFNDNKDMYEGKTLEDATPEIREKLYRAQVERKFTKWIAALREKAHIKIIQ